MARKPKPGPKLHVPPTLPASLYDEVAERLVARGLLLAPAATVAALRDAEFDPADCYHWHHQCAIRELIPVARAEPDLVAAYHALKRAQRAGRIDPDARRHGLVAYVIDAVGTQPYADWGAERLRRWDGDDPLAAPDVYAAAAARCVRHLCARRTAWHAATELLRDATDPVSDAGDYYDRASQLEGFQ